MDLSPSASEPLDLGKLSPWAPELARTFVALSSDIALVIDAGGVIRAVEQGNDEPLAPAAHAWVGRSWIDTVSVDTRGKVEKLLKEASSHGIARRREVSHPLHSGTSVPVAYTAIRLGEHGPVLAVGRDLRAIAAIQERFIETQQDMERGYWSARQAESRYRLLFQVATDAVMVIDPETLLILDANPAAGTLFSSAGEPLIGKHATIGFAHPSRAAVNELLATARSSGQSGEIRARLLGSVAMTCVAATSFRADDAMRLLVRVRAVDTAASTGPDSVADAAIAGESTAAAANEATEDAAAITDSSGRILLANPAFLRLVRVDGEEQATGRSLIDWLGALEHSLDGLISQVRRKGVVGSFAATLRPAIGLGTLVDVSAALLTDGDQECIGFTLRRAPTPVREVPALAPELSVDLSRLVERVGELSLTRLVREAAALAEAHFIQLALERSGGDADAAASLLGIDRDRLAGPATHPASAPT
jgi:transcriptional regulator PpsR